MRILILANNDVGLYRFRKELLEELLKEHEVYISLPQGGFIENLCEMGCHYVETPIDRRGINPITDFKLFRHYLRMLKEIKPDVAITYTIKPNVYGGVACRLKKIPYLANVTGLGTSIENKGIVQKIALSMYRAGVKKAECLFFQNNANKEFMEAKGVSGKSTRLLPGSGVNLTANYYRAYPEDQSEIRFLNIQRVMKDKGIEELLGCVESITEKYPFAKFIIAGDYDDEIYRAPIEDAVKRGKLTYLGYRKDIADLMANSHAIIHPSYHEGLSNVLLEAASCGRPVIASDIPGCRETFDEGVTGFGAKVRSKESLAEAVERFINLPYAEKEEMGRKGREKVEREFDRKLVIRAYKEEIDKIFTEATK